MRRHTPGWLAWSHCFLGLLIGCPLLAQIAAPPDLANSPARVNRTPATDSAAVALSPDGRFVVLASAAAGLTADAVGGRHVQLYLRDIQQDAIRLVSRTAGGGGEGNSGQAVLSSDGRWVAFASQAPDLTPNDTNGVSDVFLSDPFAGGLRLVSRNANGTAPATGASTSPAMSADGRWVAYASTAIDLVTGMVDANNAADVFLFDAETETTRLLSQQVGLTQTGTHPASDPVISPDGRWVAFTSASLRLAPGTPAVGTDLKLYLHDIAANANRWASGGAAAFSGPVPLTRRFVSKATFSDDGRFLIYAVGPLVLRYATETETTTLVASNLAEGGLPAFGTRTLAVSPDGSLIAFPGTSANALQAPRPPEAIYLWRSATSEVEPLPRPFADAAALGQVGAPALSSEGRYVAYLAQVVSAPADLSVAPGWHLFRYDLQQAATELVSTSLTDPLAGVPGLIQPLWSSDLRRLAFSSATTNLTPDDHNGALDAFLLEVEPVHLRALSLVDGVLTPATPLGSSWIRPQPLSADGRWLVFTSAAADLSALDDNGVGDVFLSDLQTGATTLVSANAAGTAAGTGHSHSPVISADGQRVAFVSLASDLVPDDTNELNDVFVRDLPTGTTLLVSANPERTSSGSGSSVAPSISADGRWIAYESRATNLIGAELTDFNAARSDVFVFDTIGQTNDLVSVRTDGLGTGSDQSLQPVISPDGRRVLFQSLARDLVTPAPSLPPRAAGGHIRDLADRQTSAVALPDAAVFQVAPAENRPQWVSADSTTYAQAGIASPYRGIAVQRFGAETVFLSLTNAEGPSLSADGRYLAYAQQSAPTSPKQVYLQDLVAATTNLISVALDGTTPGSAGSSQAVVSGDGRYVVFKSLATNLVTGPVGDWGQVFVRDVAAGTTLHLSRPASGGSPNGASVTPHLAADGRTVVFLSFASDLVANDQNVASDVFVARLGSGPVADSDQDGLPDDWEMAFFGTLARDGSGDYDEDGSPDRHEYLAGTNPAGNQSIFRALTVWFPGANETTVVWSAVAGRTYRVQFRDRLDEGTWIDLPGDVTASAETATRTDASGGAGPQRFYRVLAVP